MTKFFKHAALALTAGTMAVLAAPAAAADIQSIFKSDAPSVSSQSDSEWNRNRRDRYDRDDRRYSRDRDYRRDRDSRNWRGRNENCARSSGTTGLVVGGAAGALLGREIDGGRDRTLGTVLGAAGGALLGREVERGGSRRC